MAEQAALGGIYRIDKQDHKPPHLHIILTEPSYILSEFAMVSWTDRHNFPLSADVWERDFHVCTSVKLTKPSVIAVRYAAVHDQHWLNGCSAEYLGAAPAEVIARARCNVVWYRHFVPPAVLKYLNAHLDQWRSECGDSPNATP